MTPSRVEVEDREGGLRVLTLVHPARKGALDDGMVEALDRALAPEATLHVRAFLVRGTGGAFCSGYDLTGLGPAGPGGALPDDALMAMLARLEAHPAPSVALVTGAAFGAGFDLACACDFRVAAEGSVFCMPPSRLGVVYAADGIRRASRTVGPARAKLLFLTGRRVDARTALEWGLVDALASAHHAEAEALGLCAELAAGAPLALAGMKETFRRLGHGPLGSEAHQHLRELRAQAFASDDAREGRAAFLEKRPPRFRGH